MQRTILHLITKENFHLPKLCEAIKYNMAILLLPQRSLNLEPVEVSEWTSKAVPCKVNLQ